MADKKLDKTTLTIIGVVVILIVLAILIWLSQKKKDKDISNGEPPVDLINAGTPNYMEIIRYDWGLEYRYARGGNIYTYDDPNWEVLVERLDSNLNQGWINQLQYDNAMAQFELLGYY